MTARILVVDDTRIWRNIIHRALRDKYHVDTAVSLEEAQNLLKDSDPYQVLITDIGLSDDETNTDGIDLLRIAHELSPNTKSIAISGRAAMVNEERFKAAYHTLAYLDRDVLSSDMQAFLELVDKGVALSYQEQE